MELCRDYLPTRSYRIAEMRMASLLGSEIDRLDKVAAGLGREYAIGPDNLKQELPNITAFAREYHRAYDLYLKAVLPQQDKPIQCRPACGNCCHHYPMSVEPFELVGLYLQLREREDFITIMEKCQSRSDLFNSLFEKRLASVCSEDEAEDHALHDYFEQWRPCPFSDKTRQGKQHPTAFLRFSFCCLPVNFYSREMPTFHMLFSVVYLFEKKQSKRTKDA